MNNRSMKFLYMALIPLAAGVVISGFPQGKMYQRLSHLLLTTSSMEAAANGGAIGEDLPQP
jgi:hypothetical protein